MGMTEVLTASQHVVRGVEERIQSGDLKPGCSLPSERSLARLLRVNRAAVREAKAQLLERGTLVLVRGRARIHPGLVTDREPQRENPSVWWRHALGARRALWVVWCRRVARRPSKWRRAVAEGWSRFSFALTLSSSQDELMRAYGELGSSLAQATGNKMFHWLQYRFHRDWAASRELWEALYSLGPIECRIVHHSIFEAVAAGDGKKAVATIRRELAAFDRRWCQLAASIWKNSPP